MAIIKVLEKHVADKIAAGEVVDRPVSIVKELVENAIDSGATSVTIEIRNGGKTYIRVTDNGCGIAADDVETAFQRHATSKIAKASDLDSIMTLGFRGEALASICAVSRVEIITKCPDARTGRRVIAESSKILQNSPTGCPDGTTITVKDLFYNVPARLKFLGSDGAEARRIVDLVSRIALAYPDIRFRLINGGKPVFQTTGKGIIMDNIVQIYGSDIGKDLIPVDFARGDNIVRGFVTNPGFSMPSRARQIFCVNGRVVSSPVVEKAVEKAYQERLFPGRFPAAFLFLTVSANKLDVNIHPTKKEVRFDDNAEVEDFVTDAIQGSLQVKEAIPEVRSDAAALSELNPFEKVDQGEQIDVKKLLSTLREETIKYDEKFLQKEADAQPTKLVSETAADQRESTDVPGGMAVNQGEVSGVLGVSASTVENTGVDLGSAASMMKYSEADLSGSSSAKTPFDIDELQIIGALFNTYILAYQGDEFYMIDQHAAHERIFYEKLRGQYEAQETYSQQLMVPLQFHVSADVTASEEQWLPLVQQMGYAAEYFGNQTYIVREIPAFMEMEEAEQFLQDLFQQFTERPDLTNTAVIDKIIIRSCKSAVKAGDVLTQEEIVALLDQLKRCNNPFSCPHGRPTFIRMSRYEIEKRFKRVT